MTDNNTLNFSPIILGSTTLDENIIQGKRFKKIGGVPVYAGLTYKKLGPDPRIITNFAENDRCIPEFFNFQGISLTNGPSRHTTRFINEYHKDGHRAQQLLSAACPILPEQLLEMGNKMKHIHLGPLHPFDIDPSVYRLELDTELVTLDIQGLTRCIENSEVKQTVSHDIIDALKAAQIIKADNIELAMMLKYLNGTIPEIMTRFHLQEIVETRANSGGLVHTPNGTIAYSARRKKRIIDTTGSGDVFFAAYLVTRFYNNQDIQTACEFAAGIAARHIEGNFLPLNAKFF